MQSIEKEQMISFEVSLGEVAVKRKLKFRQKVALILPLSNKLKSAPKFARARDLRVRLAQGTAAPKQAIVGVFLRRERGCCTQERG